SSPNAPAPDSKSPDRLRLVIAVREVSGNELRGFYLPMSGTYGIGSVRLTVERQVVVVGERGSGAGAPPPPRGWEGGAGGRGPRGRGDHGSGGRSGRHLRGRSPRGRRVAMSRSLGRFLPRDLLELLSQKDLTRLLGRVLPMITLGPDGHPHPMLCTYLEVLA